MSKNIEKTGSNRSMDKNLTPAEQQVKLAQLREALGPLSSRASIFCTDDCLHRHLRARNWNVKKAEKMLKEAIRWRASYKPEEIKWDEVAHEAETGKVYRAHFSDKEGRTVIIMRPAKQNTTEPYGQIRLLLYSLENAILNLPPGQEQMVWLVDFKKWTIRQAFAVSTAREIAYVFQTMYPERLKFCVVYDAPWLFEKVWGAIKTFLDPETFNKVKFAYTKKSESLKIVEESFEMDRLEVALGGRNTSVYNHQDYGRQMKLDDVKTAQYWKLDEATNASTIKLDAQEKEPSLKENHLENAAVHPATEGV